MYRQPMCGKFTAKAPGCGIVDFPQRLAGEPGGGGEGGGESQVTSRVGGMLPVINPPEPHVGARRYSEQRMIHSNNASQTYEKALKGPNLWLVLLAVMAALSSIVSFSIPSANARDAIQPPVVEQPASLEAVIANLKAALETGVLLDPEFFADTNLRRYFGGRQIDKSDNSPTPRIVGFVHDFDRIVSPLVIGGREVEGITFAFQYRIDEDGSPVSSLTISLSGTTAVDFQVVTSIFGGDWKYAEWRLQSPHKRVFPRTAEHGNDEIEYVGTGTSWTWGATFEFNEGAYLSIASFGAKGRPAPK